MATSEEQMNQIVQHIAGDNIRVAKMFGEYTLYCNEKVVALVADGQLFLKITPASGAQFGPSQEAPPYPGSKPYFLVPTEKLSDSAWLTRLINDVAADLPAPKPKKPKLS